MDRSRGATAADLVNSLSVAELTELFADNGEGRFARRLAEGIVASRPIETTSRLVEVIDRSLPGVARKRPGHPAKRVFQALRIEVNEELEVLAPGSRARSTCCAREAAASCCRTTRERTGSSSSASSAPRAAAASARRACRASAARWGPSGSSRAALACRAPAETAREPACGKCQAAGRGAPLRGRRPDGQHRACGLTAARALPRSEPASPLARRRPSRRAQARRRRSRRAASRVGPPPGDMLLGSRRHVRRRRPGGDRRRPTFVASDQQRIDTLQGQLTQTLAAAAGPAARRAPSSSPPCECWPSPSGSSGWSAPSRSPTCAPVDPGRLWRRPEPARSPGGRRLRSTPALGSRTASRPHEHGSRLVADRERCRRGQRTRVSELDRVPAGVEGPFGPEPGHRARAAHQAPQRPVIGARGAPGARDSQARP